MKTALIVTLILVAVLVSGCFENQRTWGKGELPKEWQDYFGDGNNSRMNYVQSQAIDKHQALLYGLNTRGPNGKIVRKKGIIERLAEVRAAVDEIKISEKHDPNE